MLNERPGNYIWMSVDRPSHRSGKLRHPDYDFNDAAIPHGVAPWPALVDRLPHGGGISCRRRLLTRRRFGPSANDTALESESKEM